MLLLHIRAETERDPRSQPLVVFLTLKGELSLNFSQFIFTGIVSNYKLALFFHTSELYFKTSDL